MLSTASGEAGWHVGDDIRKARTNARLEQAELARRVGVARSTVSKWERGISEPSYSQYRRIAQVTDSHWLLTESVRLVRLPHEQTEFVFSDPPDLDVIDCTRS